MLPDIDSEETQFKFIDNVTIFGETFMHYERHIVDVPGGDIPMISNDDAPGNFEYVRDDY